MSQFKRLRRIQKDPITPLPLSTERNTDRLQMEEYLTKLADSLDPSASQIFSDGPNRTKFMDRKDRGPIERVGAAIRNHIRQRADKAPPTQVFVCQEFALLLIEDICSVSAEGFSGKLYYPDWIGGIYEIALGIDLMINECLDVNTVICVYK